MPDTKNLEDEDDGRLTQKDYERELARLHIEFVKLQQWVALRHIRDEELPSSKVKLPKRQERGDYNETDYPYRVVSEVY